MSWSPQWDALYEKNSYPGTHPPFEKLLSTFITEAPRLLELGCGNGPNIPFITNYLRFGWHGIDGSSIAVKRIREAYPNLSANVMRGDFTKSLLFGGKFDAIVERASLAHNDMDAIRDSVSLIYDALNPGGLFVSSDWFSTQHSEFSRGEIVDRYTRRDYPDGQFHGAGKVNFMDELALTALFANFERLHLEERMMRRPVPGLFCERDRRRWISPAFDGKEYRTALWDLVARKPK